MNDTVRECMAAIARWYQDNDGGLVTAGTGAAYTLTTSSAFAALGDISAMIVRIHTANTGAATLAVDGLTAKNLFIRGAALAANDLLANVLVVVSYNANQDRFDVHHSLPRTTSAADLTSGTLPEARLSAVVFASPTNADVREIGYRGIPQNVQNGDYTLVLSDAGKSIDKQSGGAGETITIPANSSVAFPIGTVVCGDNDGGGSLTIAITTDTLEDSAGSTGSRTVADNGSWVIKKIAATKWRITGSGIS